MATIIDPTRIFEIKGQVCPLYAQFASLAVGNNQQVIAAVSGSIIRVMGGVFQSNNVAAGVTRLLDGSGGTILMSHYMPVNTLPPFLMPITESGYFNTTVSTGLFADVVTQAQVFSIFYITYKP